MCYAGIETMLSIFNDLEVSSWFHQKSAVQEKQQTAEAQNEE